MPPDNANGDPSSWLASDERRSQSLGVSQVSGFDQQHIQIVVPHGHAMFVLPPTIDQINFP